MLVEGFLKAFPNAKFPSECAGIWVRDFAKFVVPARARFALALEAPCSLEGVGAALGGAHATGHVAPIRQQRVE